MGTNANGDVMGQIIWLRVSIHSIDITEPLTKIITLGIMGEREDMQEDERRVMQEDTQDGVHLRCNCGIVPYLHPIVGCTYMSGVH